MFVGVEAPWRALQSHFVNLKDIWEGALSQFIHCRVIQRALPHQDSNKKKIPQKTLVLIRVAKSKLSSVEKPITQTRVCYTDSVQLWEFNAFNSSAIPKPVKKKATTATCSLISAGVGSLRVTVIDGTFHRDSY